MTRWALLLLFATTLASAHEVHTRIEAAGAVVVTLTYANGQPFAYEKYALTPAGQDTPRQVGNTDAAGRIAFVPDAIDTWRLTASSADGHGVNLEFATPRPSADKQSADPSLPRWLIAAFGLSLIFGLFGLVQLFLRRKS